MSNWHQAIRDSGLATVHTTFQTKPASGQLSSRSPNIQVSPNQSKYGPLATAFREAVAAPNGHMLLEADFRSFHVLTLGYEAQCVDYIRLARLDAHSFLAANLLHLEGCQSCLALPDPELKAYLSYVKKNYEGVRNGRAKPGILGYGFGMGFTKLYELNPDAFASLDEAKYVIDMMNSLFPPLKAYRETTPELAYRQGYLMSPHKCIRWFWDVKNWDPETSRWKHGRDWQKAIAFKPANIAFCVIKQAMNRMHTNGMAERYNLINNIHDALLFCPPSHLLDECAASVKREMEMPDETVKAPDGTPFWCEVEIKTGPNWAQMKEMK